MKHFFLIVNREKENAEHGAEVIHDYLTRRGCECHRWDSEICDGFGTYGANSNYRYTDERKVPQETECVIVLGGDGTLIQAARDLAKRDIPLFGVNMGHLGYLTQISEEKEIVPALDELIQDHYRLETRMMLGGRVVSGGETVAEDISLNDIVLTGAGLYTLKFQLYVDDVLFNDYTADGMILATPTGSTAYNLSAGGPIVAPESSMMLLTPICPHTLNSRSIVLPDTSRIMIQIGGGEDVKRLISFDGDTTVELKKGDRIEVEKSNTTTKLVQLREVPFLENIRRKMRQI